mmetsp:Transcript_25717/g.55710  ORF Transcript_25717/g.55710 Transcript_25717/m.55710 type:complete len:136 (+) Transcript_25717:3-410(+)
MYISQPTGNIHYAYHDCNSSLVSWLPDGTPLLCTNSGADDLFYIPGSMGKQSCPSCELARRINAVAAAHQPPYFITVYGGLKWTAASGSPALEFWTLWSETLAKLDSNVVPVGAQEMARLARDAGAARGGALVVE